MQRSKALQTLGFLFKTILLLFLYTSKIQAQNTDSASIYDWFDSKVGKENLALNNGKLLLNYDRILNNNDRFYFSEYQSGSVVYDNQIYNSVFLNYDIVNDNLILKPYGEYSNNPIVLIKDKVARFSINGKNYVNLNYLYSTTPSFINGYYEQCYSSDKAVFYTKYIKNKSEKYSLDKVYDDFTERTYYVLLYKDIFYEINSKKSIVAIYPEMKKAINEFYANNDYLEKSNKTQFLSDLFQFLNNKN